MSAITTELPNVVDPAVLEDLGTRLAAGAEALHATTLQANERWARLPEVFAVTGAEGAFMMLVPAKTSTELFADAMEQAQKTLSDAATDTFPTLRTRRKELAARIIAVNERWDAAQSGLEYANTAYWSAYESDPASDTTRQMGTAQTDATDAWNAADAAVEELKADIRTFIHDLEDAEDEVARGLKKVSGGDTVTGAWGDEILASQASWGESIRDYPGGPPTDIGLADRLRDRLSTKVANVISWMATADPDDVEDWLDAHPDFPGAVGFVAVAPAAKLWDDLKKKSTRDAAGENWEDGPLAHLFDVAPAVIGNLNGIPADARDEFNRQTLKDWLAGDLTAEQRAQLQGLSDTLDKQKKAHPDLPIAVLSLFMDTTEGEPRATLGFGDVDGADQITTVTHGIATDLSSLDPWAASAVSMHKDLNAELARKGSSASSAVVLFMEWESGGTGDVWNIERPDAGAERLAQLQRGFEISNPGAQLDLDLHSLGTTMAAQMIADNERLVDNVWFYGSAGVSEEAAEALERQIREGDVSLHVTHADDDWIAPVGRVEISEHPVDPRTIGQATEAATGDATGRPQIFSSNGGWVEDFRTPEGEHGERTEGHNSQRSTEKIYLLDFTRVNRFEIGVDDEAVGYLDPASQSYKQSIVDHVGGILAGQRKSG